MGIKFNDIKWMLNFAFSHIAIIMRVVISLILLFASLWIILSLDYGQSEKQFAFGLIGAIIGFWLGTSITVGR